MYTMEEILKASQIFAWLLINNELTNRNNKELYEDYMDEKTQKILDTMAVANNVSISKIDSSIYMIPYTTNTDLGYSRQDLKKALIGRADVKNEEFYLASYMILLLINEFYNGQGAYIKTRVYIDISELEQAITTHLNNYENKIYEDIEKESKIPISTIANFWKGLLLEDSSKSTRTKYWYINRVVEFLIKEDLINVMNKTEIYMTKKMDMLMTYRILDTDRLDELNQILNVEDIQ